MRFKVHNVHDDIVDVPATLANGREVIGKMPAFLIELESVDPGGKSFTLTETCDTLEEIQTMRATFPVGGIVELIGFKLVEAPE